MEFLTLNRFLYLALPSASLFITLLITPRVIAFAAKRGIVDKPSKRRIHEGEVPRMGGIAIYLGFIIPLIPLFIATGRLGEPTLLMLYIVVGSLVILALGIYDDMKGANIWLKFSVQFGVAIFLVTMGFSVKVITNPFGGTINLGILGYPVTVFWIVGIINAINLSDGMDGLASGISLIALVALSTIAYIKGDSVILLLALGLAGAIVGFLPYNFYPAKVFMGDTGSMFLGYMLAVVSLRASAVSAATFSLLVPLVALGLPVFDTLFSIFRRFLLERRVFGADRDHIHHKILSMGFSYRQTVLILYWICLIFGFMAFVMTAARNKEIAGFVLLFAVAIYVIIENLGYLGHIVSHRHERAKKSRFERYQAEYKVESERKGRFKTLTRKPVAIAALDFLIVNLALYGAIVLVHRTDMESWEFIWKHKHHFALATLFFYGSFVVMGCYRVVGKYVGFHEVGKFIKSIFGAVIVSYFFSDYLLPGGSLHLNVYLAYLLLLLSGILATRIARNFYYNFTKRQITSSKTGERVLIYGAGDSGEALTHMITKNDDIDYNLLGFIDDDPDKKNLTVSGYRIVGDVYALPEVMRNLNIGRVIVSTRHLNKRRETALRFYAERHGVKLSRFNLSFEEY